jgi:hypothetical protein
MMAMMEGHSRAVSRVLPLAGLDRIARRCMRGAPDDRYPSSAALLADLRALEGARPASVPAPHHDALWWWQFHQVAAATLNGLMPVVAWALRRWMHPFGSAMFLAALTLASISVTLRLNLWFTSRVHPEMLADHRARLFPAILCADATLALVFVAGGTFMAGQHDEVAALLLSVGVVTLASLALIEPATTRGAGLAQR